MTGQEKYADKIAGLLRKAESTTPEEAEALVAKAQELMTKYAIDEAMIAAASGKTADDVIENRTLLAFVGIYRDAQMEIATQLCKVNNCKPVMRTHQHEWTTRTVGGKDYKDWTELIITGYRSDIDRLELMNASLQIQCAQALGKWYRDAKMSWWSKTDTFREKRQFIIGFAQGVGNKLAVATEAGRAAAKAAEAERTGATAEAASESVELVLRDRKDTVQDWFDTHYGNTLRTRYSRRAPGSRSSGDAGRSAGASADIGQSGLRSQGELGS